MTSPLFETPAAVAPVAAAGTDPVNTHALGVLAGALPVAQDFGDGSGGSRAIVSGEAGVALLPVRDRRTNGIVYAQIDADLAPAIGVWRWSLDDGYVFRMERLSDGTQRQISLHRLVMCCAKGDGLEIDHINRDRLDNRRANLRYATRAENVANRGSSCCTGCRKRVIYTACRNGHPYTSETTTTTRRGHNRCLICQRAGEARRVERRRAERQAGSGRNP